MSNADKYKFNITLKDEDHNVSLDIAENYWQHFLE